MPIVAEHNCPYCKKKIVVETVKGETFPLGTVKLHTVKDYEKQRNKEIEG